MKADPFLTVGVDVQRDGVQAEVMINGEPATIAGAPLLSPASPDDPAVLGVSEVKTRTPNRQALAVLLGAFALMSPRPGVFGEFSLGDVDPDSRPEGRDGKSYQSFPVRTRLGAE